MASEPKYTPEEYKQLLEMLQRRCYSLIGFINMKLNDKKGCPKVIWDNECRMAMEVILALCGGEVLDSIQDKLIKKWLELADRQ